MSLAVAIWDVLVPLNALQFVLIVYLALAISKLRERISRMEGYLERIEQNGSGS